MFSRIAFFIAFVCFSSGVPALQTADAQSVQERHDQIRASIEAGRLAAAISELRSLQAADSATFRLNNYDYLFARLAEQRGDFAFSSSGYQSVIARHSPLAQYALWHLAQIARSTGDLALEREQLRLLITTAPASLLREAAIMRLAQSFFDSGDYARVVSTLRPLTESKNTTAARQSLVLIGQTYLRSGKPADAREAFTRQVTQMPDTSRPDDFALAAARGLDQLDSGNATATQTSTTLSEADQLRRASIYQFNRDFDAARLHYLALVESHGESSAVPEVLLQLGRGYYQRGKYADALKYLQRLQDLSPTSTNDADVYVAEIGFSQAKDYVFIVMSNFWVYQQLYSEKLQRR